MENTFIPLSDEEFGKQLWSIHPKLRVFVMGKKFTCLRQTEDFLYDCIEHLWIKREFYNPALSKLYTWSVHVIRNLDINFHKKRKITYVSINHNDTNNESSTGDIGDIYSYEIYKAEENQDELSDDWLSLIAALTSKEKAYIQFRLEGYNINESYTRLHLNKYFGRKLIYTLKDKTTDYIGVLSTAKKTRIFLPSTIPFYGNATFTSKIQIRRPE